MLARDASLIRFPILKTRSKRKLEKTVVVAKGLITFVFALVVSFWILEKLDRIGSFEVSIAVLNASPYIALASFILLTSNERASRVAFFYGLWLLVTTVFFYQHMDDDPQGAILILVIPIYGWLLGFVVVVVALRFGRRGKENEKGKRKR